MSRSLTSSPGAVSHDSHNLLIYKKNILVARSVQSRWYGQLIRFWRGLTMNLNKATLVQGLTGCMALASGAANAGFITVDTVGGIYATDTRLVASNNEFLGPLGGLGVLEYTLGTSLATDAAGSVAFFYYGKEAGYSNQFVAPGAATYTTGFSPYQDNFGAPLAFGGSLAVGAGVNLLDFRFCAFTNVLDPGNCMTNGDNDSARYSDDQSIAMSIIGNSAWLFWDDSGAGPDDNHDDMLVRAVFTPASVPEPTSLGLLGAGLLGVWFTMRGRRRQGLVAAI
jgi:hypothetical protein